MIEKKIALRRMVCVFFSLLQVRQAANPQGHARYHCEGIDVSRESFNKNIILLETLGISLGFVCSEYDRLEDYCLDYKQVKNNLVQKGIRFDDCDIDAVDIRSDEDQGSYELLALSSSRWSFIRNIRTKQACGLAHETEDSVIPGSMYCEQARECKEYCEMIKDMDIVSTNNLSFESVVVGYN